MLLHGCVVQLTGEDLQADLGESGEGRLVQHTDAAHLLHLGRVHTLPAYWLQDVPHRRGLLECPFEQICKITE